MIFCVTIALISMVHGDYEELKDLTEDDNEVHNSAAFSMNIKDLTITRSIQLLHS
ncbi:hypothetical protein LINPERPRIM_LOCUS43024 [Linum perenne]